jgi:hypothetical protein
LALSGNEPANSQGEEVMQRRTSSAAIALTAVALGAATLGCSLTPAVAQVGSSPAPVVESVSQLYGADIGDVKVPGQTRFLSDPFLSGGTTLISASGSDIWGKSDAFRYYYQPWDAVNGEVIVKVEGLDRTDPWAKAGIMMRRDLSPGSEHAFVAITGSNGAVFQGRYVKSFDSFSKSGSGGTAPRWLKLERLGNVLRGYESSDGMTWSPIGAAEIALPEKCFIGLAVTSHNAGKLTTAGFTSYKIQQSPRT